MGKFQNQYDKYFLIFIHNTRTNKNIINITCITFFLHTRSSNIMIIILFITPYFIYCIFKKITVSFYKKSPLMKYERGWFK